MMLLRAIVSYRAWKWPLKSPHISPHMTNSLLQLAEFMDMKDKRLPLDVILLARCAEKANMYAKALRYRESSV